MNIVTYSCRLLTKILSFALLMVSVQSLAAKVPTTGVVLAKQQKLFRGNGAEVAGIDPHKVQGVPESRILADLFEGLVSQDGDGEIIPGAAISWSNENNKIFTFTLRTDAKWSNGDPVTAYDFVYSFRRLSNPETASPYASYLADASVKNAAAIVKGKKPINTLGVSAVGEHKLKIELTASVPYFVKMMLHTSVYPVNKKVIETYQDNWTKPEHFVSNGAYRLASWRINDRMVLKRNEKYWDNSNTIIKEVSYLPIENQITELARFKTNELDITNEFPANKVLFANERKLKNASALKEADRLCVYYYEFNNNKKPFDDVRVRKALSYAIDRKQLVNEVLGLGQKPGYTYTHAGIDGFTPPVPSIYKNKNQQERNRKAKKLLKEAGYGSAKTLAFKLLYNNSDNHQQVAEAIVGMWSKVFKDQEPQVSMWKRLFTSNKKSKPWIDVTLENKEWKTYLDSRSTQDFDVARAGWCADYNEASTFLGQLQSTTSTNNTAFADKDYDKIMQKALNATNENERNTYYKQAEQIIAEQVPVIPIYHYVNVRLVNPKLKGYKNNPQDIIYTKDLYFIK